MKLEIKVGDKVQVTEGKYAGKEAKVLFVDKKTLRYRLDGLKKQTSKTKKGQTKELHSTFHLTSLKAIKPEPKVEEQPKKEEAATQPAEKTEASAPV